MSLYSWFLKTSFSPCLGFVRLLLGLVLAEGTESLTFGQTFKLTLEIRLIILIVHKNYVIPLSALENLIFSRFGPIRL